MVFNWTDADEKLLLMRIIAQTGMKAPDFNEVVSGMPEGVTVEACKHRMRKIKKEIEAMEAGTSPASSGGGAAAGSTPAKSGASKKAKYTPAPGKRKAGKKAAAESDESPSCDQDAEEEESPTKKLKATTVK